MSDTVLAVLIGGAIGVVPSLVIVFVEKWRQRSQQKHEIRLKHIELYEIPKREALNEFMFYVGKFSSGTYIDESELNKLTAAYGKACMYTPQEIRLLMASFLIDVTKQWENQNMKNGVFPPYNFYWSDNIKKLATALYDEIRSSLNDTKHPNSSRAEKNSK